MFVVFKTVLIRNIYSRHNSAKTNSVTRYENGQVHVADKIIYSPRYEIIPFASCKMNHLLATSHS